MDDGLLGFALKASQPNSGENGGSTRSLRSARRYLQSLAESARAEADLLEAIAADYESAGQAWEHVPGAKSLSHSQLKAVWDGVNDQAKRLLGAFATHGGAMTQQDIMDVLGVDEPRLINGPLGGISRRVKKLLGDSEASFYGIHPDDGRYFLQTETFEALCDLIERERPGLLSSEPRARNATSGNTHSAKEHSDE